MLAGIWRSYWFYHSELWYPAAPGTFNRKTPPPGLKQGFSHRTWIAHRIFRRYPMIESVNEKPSAESSLLIYGQTWASGVFEGTRGGSRSVTRPVKNQSVGYPSIIRYPVLNRVFRVEFFHSVSQ
jgi:hypothetical protein